MSIFKELEDVRWVYSGQYVGSSDHSSYEVFAENRALYDVWQNTNINNDSVEFLQGVLDNAGSVIGDIEQVPVGALMCGVWNPPPNGWLFCNGASFYAHIYDALFSVIGYTYGGSGGVFQVPDLRGKFIRGLDSGRGLDPGRVLGSSQEEMFREHSHNVWILGASHYRGDDAGFGSNYRTSTPVLETEFYGGNETRPYNMNLYYYIRY